MMMIRTGAVATVIETPRMVGTWKSIGCVMREMEVTKRPQAS